MKIRKSVQKLMPYGVEVILQGETLSPVHVKVVIRKRFDRKLDADEWVEKKRDDMRKAIEAERRKSGNYSPFII